MTHSGVQLVFEHGCCRAGDDGFQASREQWSLRNPKPGNVALPQASIGLNHAICRCVLAVEFPQWVHDANRTWALTSSRHSAAPSAFPSARRSEAVRAFLQAMRHSQLYEMFIQERLAMAASGAIELPTISGSVGQSFSCAGVGHGVRMRRYMYKSSSASNLTSLEKSSQGSSCGPASVHASDLTVLGEDGAMAGCVGEGSGVCTQNPFELRVERYPERRRLLREQMRSMIGETATAGGAGGGGGGKLASKLRRHRRTDSEDTISQPPLQSGESMRRITTYPGLVGAFGPWVGVVW